MKKYIYILLSVIAAVSCRKDKLFEQVPYSLETSTKMAREIVEGAPDYFGHIKHDKVTNLAQGVSLLDMAYLNKNGYAMQLYMFKVILGTSTITVSSPATDQKLAPLSEQVSLLNNSVTVLGAVNGDAYSATDKLPTGILYRNGNAIKTTFSDAKGGFFATLADGTAVIGEQADYSTYRRSIQNALGTRTRILQGGYPVMIEGDKNAARTFVAVSADKMTVWAGVVDGVYFYYSHGISCSDLAAVLLAAGASEAALLESGPQTTMVRRDDLGEQLFVVCNTPSENGIEQSAVNGLAIVEN